MYEGFGFSIRVKAVRAQTQPGQIVGAGEIQIGKTLSDWLIVADEFYDGDGAPVLPQIGATITPESGDGVYELVEGPSGKCYTPSDGREVRFRVHTDKINEAS